LGDFTGSHLSADSTRAERKDDSDLSFFVQRVRQKSLAYVSFLDVPEGLASSLFQGKMFRSQLTRVVGVAVKAKDHLCEAVAASVEMVHEASLCHDDIQDGQILRRGRQSLWKKVGLNQAINIGDLLAALAYRPLLELENPQSKTMVNHLNQVVREVIHGQILEQESLGRILSRAAYERIAVLKTGSLLAAGPQLLCLARGQTLLMQPLTEALHHLGLAFQFSNDVSLVSHEGLLLDIQNRTSSLPIILLSERLSSQGVEINWELLLTDVARLMELMERHKITDAVSKMVEAHLKVFKHKMRTVNRNLEAHCDLLIAQVCSKPVKQFV
jgi:geranylgeranyl pyrophosphate synthase